MTRLGLSEDEKILAGRLVAKAEARVRRWPWVRWIHLSHAAFWFLFGVWCGPLSSDFPFGTGSCPDVSDQLKLRGDPSDLPTVAEVRRAAQILDAQYEVRVTEAILALFAIAAFIVGALYVGFDVDRWKDGPRLALIAKILRAKWDAETKPEGSPGA